MPESITRREFVDQLASDGGSLNINDLSPEVAQKLADAKVTAADLARIAGGDAQISGKKEMGALFDLLDKVDHDHNSNTFVTSTDTPAGPAPTQAGAAFQALKQEVADRRLASHSEGIVHLGMRPESDAEVRALENVTPASKGGVTAIRAYDSDGVVSITPGGRTFDLKTTAGQDDFKAALKAPPLGMSDSRADKFMDAIRNTRATSRDEVAQLGLAMHRIGTGELKADRLVLSGHGTGDGIFGNGGSVDNDTVRKLAEVFPEGAGKIHHLNLANCFSGGEETLDKYRSSFPNLKSVWAYNGFSPKAEEGAPVHLKDWAGKTDGDDPSRVDPRGSNVATWNKADGRKGFPQLTVADAEDAIRRTQGVWEDYRTGRKTLKEGEHDPQLDRFYERIQDALALRDLSPTRRAELTTLRDQVLTARHPGLTR
jgi:hypothetical protein